MMRIAIFGVGAMGCLFGSRLAPHADVTLIGRWPEQIDALQNGSLQIIGSDGVAQSTVSLAVTNDPTILAPVDLALILTKSAKTERAARQAAAVLKPSGIALTLQNGIGNLEIIAGQVGPERAALGVTAMGASMDGPGVLRLGGRGSTHLATRPEISHQVRAAAALFVEAGFETEVVEDVTGLVWGKLAINAGINPLTALLHVRNGALAESEWARDLMHEAAREVEAVAGVQGISLPFADAAARTEEVARLTAANRSSMLQDVSRGARTEIEVICGAVVRSGQNMGIPTPVNALLYRLVKAVEELNPQ
jgi:2-dehydropantoate 2-reductase